MYVKIGYVEKYSNPCLRGVTVSLATGIWFAALLSAMPILLPMGDKVYELPIPEPLQFRITWLLGPVFCLVDLFLPRFSHSYYHCR